MSATFFVFLPRASGKTKTRSTMNTVLCLAVLAAVCCSVDSKNSPPKVQVYSLKPGKFGNENRLICHVKDFHPPDITIDLMKDGVELPGAVQTDLSFGTNWQFHLTKDVAFTPEDKHEYSCRVTHGERVKHYIWDSSM